MGKKKSSKSNVSQQNFDRYSRRDAHRQKISGSSHESVIAGESSSKIFQGDDYESEDECEEVESTLSPKSLTVGIYLWEFGQNDPKRDSGSKMCRLGYANKLRIGQGFGGIVLSSSASTFVNPKDKELIQKFGIAGINCSWNRLEEIPFDAMGKSRNHRLLPLLFAANSVNYGKPFKMNTAEATAACLYIAGFKDDAAAILSPFGYGPEFLRLNLIALEAYCTCNSSEEVSGLHESYLRDAESRVLAKEQKKDLDRFASKIGGYMDDMDLPPEEDYEEEEEDHVEEDSNLLVDNIDRNYVDDK
mmetsp:Transcript_12340/g.16960  ORF Transcript_12340/g.16960 Transcript_12340/m.16960 type:complete len:303 (-) Transcript_12340:6-914(-)